MKLIYPVLFLFLSSCTVTKIVKVTSDESGNARAFGAIPDDGIDDTRAIQLALNTGFLQLESGTYLISQTLFYSP